MFSEHRPLIIAAALSVPFALNSGISRAEAPGQEGVRVSVSDIDLSTQVGVKTLYSRIHVAAKRYCESVFTHTGSRISAGYEGCVVDAVNNTVHSLNLPALTALHENREGPQKKG